MKRTSKMRKLAAILSADGQGYSRLMGDDEALTVQTITRYRELFARCVDNHGGRVVNMPGDSVLAEFPSVVDAVACSMAIQEQLASANAGLPEHRRMHFRIGINLGDVIQNGEDIYGDGVNIAARVEALADGGGICITGPVYDQVKNRFPQLDFQYRGKHDVKNIVDPVRVYRIVLWRTHDSALPLKGRASSDERKGHQGREPVTIGIMPFENFSGSRDEDYFSIGFVEDLTTDLAHFSNLQVIASYTTRKMVEAAKNLMTIARELGIDYLLRGNLRRMGEQLRISAQLTATDGGHILWAERYDAPVNTLFEIQDDIVARVVSAISTQIDRALLAAARKKPITSMAAYDLWLRGMARLRKGTPAADQDARRMFKQALAVDPHYSRAYAGLSLSHFNDWSCQLWEQWEITERNAYDYAMKAYQLDETDHVVQMILGRILLYRRQFDLAAYHLDQALSLNANDADNLVQIASSMGWLGRPAEGEHLFLKGLRLNPYHDNWYYTYGAFPYFVQQRYDTFTNTALKGPLTEVWIDQPAYLAAAYAHLGNSDLAADYLHLFIETFTREIFGGHPPQPSEVVDWIRKANPFKTESDLASLIAGLVSAGLAYRAPRAAKPSGHQNEMVATPTPGEFKKKEGMWQMTFEGATAALPEVKGFHDLVRLLARPEEEIHCTALMGVPEPAGEGEPVIDERARREYETRIRDLKTDIDEAEVLNDLGRKEVLTEELDRLTTHLVQALGLGGRTREVNPTVDRARSAVTWRIRSAIRKIRTVHPSLANHLSHAIRTGAFCCYAPEKEHVWHL